MTTYKGESLTPRNATSEEIKAINSVLTKREQVKVLMEEVSNEMKKIPKGQPLVVQEPLNRDSSGELTLGPRTFIVDEPQGHYVTYRELEFTMNAKTTKKDLTEVSS